MNVLTREYLQELFDTMGYRSDIQKAMGLNPTSGGGYRTLEKYINQYQIDLTKHNLLAKEQRKLKHRGGLGKIYNKDTVFELSNGQNINRKIIKEIIIKNNLLPYICDECGISDSYNKKPIVLQIDHIDGNNKHNLLENFRFLCPNCHSQTPTFAGRNGKIKKFSKRTRREYWDVVNGELKEKNRDLINLVENSTIDFSVYGWNAKVAKLINKHPQKITKWMRRYMPEKYKTCRKRKGTF